MAARKTVGVVGGGSAGFTAAQVAASLGARVLFFMGDNADHASLCVNAGCMPSKALFEPIDAMHHARRLGWWKVEPKQPDQLLAEIVAWKDREIEEFRQFRQREIRECKSENFQIIRTNARFVDPHTLEAAGERYRVDAVIIATGSSVAAPPIKGLEEIRADVWTSNEILRNTRLPRSLAVVGGGAIGLEFALRYARLGCAVSVCARTRLLSRYPAKFGERLVEIYRREGVEVLIDHEVVQITRGTKDSFRLKIDGADGSRSVSAQRVLLATGRRPALDSVNLKAAGIEVGGHGGLVTGENMRVAGHDHIFAAGDCNGKRLVVHHAHIEGGIAAENAVTCGARKWSRRANLQVVFSDPEFAYAGLRPEEAEKAGHRVITADEESREIGKLHLAGDNFGFGEFVADAESHHLLGAGLLCQDASNMIHLPAYAIEHQHTVHQLAGAEYYHPTKIELVSSIADKLCAQLGGTPFRRAPE